MAPLEIGRLLARVRRMGIEIGRVHFFPVIASTQDEAVRLAHAGAPEGTLVVAGRQTRGRGRVGRTWFSPAGAGLYASLVLRPPVPPSEWPVLSVLAGVAVVEEIQRLGVTQARLKWPNDALIGGRKVAGILTEAFPDAGFAVLGLGLNASFRGVEVPPDLAEVATDLETHLQPGTDLNEAAARVLLAVIASYQRALPDLRIVPDRAGRLLWTAGEVVVGGVRGRVAGLTPAGELWLVEEDGHAVAVSVGEVTDDRRD